jgi:hypothetical protein
MEQKINKQKKRIINVIKNPMLIISYSAIKGYLNWMSDRLYLILLYKAITGKKLNIDNPITFNEKLQWLKLHNRKSEYSNYVDKYTVRSYISGTIGDEYLIPLIAVYNSVQEINWESLPNKFVLKCNHGSGINIICTDKSTLNIEEAEKKLKKWMKKNWYWFGREWPYKYVENKIIAEELLQDKNSGLPNDYKLWVFNGEVKFINVHFRDKGKTKINIYNRNWEIQNFGMVYENDLNIIHEKPKNYNKMIDYAEKMAKELELPFIRIDFYEVNAQVFFGEITFYPTSGFIKFYPNHKELDKKYGDLLEL